MACMFYYFPVCNEVCCKIQDCISLLTPLTPPFPRLPAIFPPLFFCCIISPSLVPSNTHPVITSYPSSLLYILLSFPLFSHPFLYFNSQTNYKNTSPHVVIMPLSSVSSPFLLLSIRVSLSPSLPSSRFLLVVAPLTVCHPSIHLSLPPSLFIPSVSPFILSPSLCPSSPLPIFPSPVSLHFPPSR